ncbi:coiled-coil and C2 domain-containing protein 1B [Synchiropus splendidus]|uniref:coiled-coil and C2 domain-containing protein 1B n=1 Tax=Synchiropus splendidus TaxID=270530 RepID=UPI00237E5470|nr:coiled-coil and C2 domain-containing protein 1B [Synchiropus splendidus]
MAWMKRAPPPKGGGSNAAKQLGMFMDMDPEQMMMGMEDDNLDNPELLAELAALTGNNRPPAAGKGKHKGKTPLPMEDIARMADECMRDVDEDEDDDEDVEGDENLLAELQEVVGEDDEEEAVGESEDEDAPPDASESIAATKLPSPTTQVVKPPPKAAPSSLQQTLEERISLYKTAIQNAKAAGASSKVRRYDRGLKNLETMLASVKRGKPVNEADMPPPVATGASQASSDAPEAPAVSPSLSSLPSPEESARGVASQNTQTEAMAATKAMLQERQSAYKMAALEAKRQGDIEQAKLLLRTSKWFASTIEALERGEDVDLSALPPPPSAVKDSGPVKDVSAESSSQVVQSAPTPAASGPVAPQSVLEALEQRQDKYRETSAQAKAKGDDRKARMYDRIAKQYQAAIRSHKAGRAVNFDELPVPPGFPPIPGHKSTGGDQGLVAALQAADKLVSTENVAEEEDDEDEESKQPKKLLLEVPAAGQRPRKTPSASPDRSPSKETLSPTAEQLVALLEGRKKQFMKAALQAKQRNDMEQAKTLLRTAKGLEPMVQAARSGRPVDITTLPSPPGEEEDEFIMVHHNDVQVSEKAEQVYSRLAKILKEQHEKCLTHSKQFTHLGNVAETTRFEKMAEGCKKSLEMLKLSQAKGLPPPKHHFEEKSFHTVRIFPELSSTDMVVEIVKGMNLPAPSGVQSHDLDAYVKFDFPFPSSDQPQKHKTTVIKNTNSPEYNQTFTLSINRNHRGFRRIVTSKGIKLELLHKGGFLRSDKPLGTALVKLDKLENESEIREIVEVMDGRKRTGGMVEVKVRLRQPLSGQDMQSSHEHWLVIDQAPGLC